MPSTRTSLVRDQQVGGSKKSYHFASNPVSYRRTACYFRVVRVKSLRRRVFLVQNDPSHPDNMKPKAGMPLDLKVKCDAEFVNRFEPVAKAWHRESTFGEIAGAQ